MRKIVVVGIICVVVLSAIIATSTFMWIESNRPIARDENANINFTRMATSTGSYIYHGRIESSNGLNLENTLNEGIYNITLYTTKNDVLWIAQKFGINGTITPSTDGWCVEDPATHARITVINTTVKDYGIGLRYFKTMSGDPVQEEKFVSDEGAVTSAYGFVNATVFPLLSHARSHLTVQHAFTGEDYMVDGGTKYITAKVIGFSMRYDGLELESARITIRVDWQGAILTCDAPADFSLSLHHTLSPVCKVKNVLAFYQANGIPVQKNPANITKVTITDVSVRYSFVPATAPIPSVTAIGAPLIVTKYSVQYSDGQIENGMDTIVRTSIVSAFGGG